MVDIDIDLHGPVSYYPSSHCHYYIHNVVSTTIAKTGPPSPLVFRGSYDHILSNNTCIST